MLTTIGAVIVLGGGAILNGIAVVAAELGTGAVLDGIAVAMVTEFGTGAVLDGIAVGFRIHSYILANGLVYAWIFALLNFN